MNTNYWKPEKGYTKKAGLYKSDTLFTRTLSRSTGAFGTGIYFIINQDDFFKKWHNNERQLYEIDLTKYNLIRGTYELHKWLNDSELVLANWAVLNSPKKMEDRRLWSTFQSVKMNSYYSKELFDKIYKQIQGVCIFDGEYDNNRHKDADSIPTYIVKALGYEGVKPANEQMDNTSYGGVIYDIKPNTIKLISEDKK